MQANCRINQQDGQKITFPGSANPKEISQQCTPATHRSSVLLEGPLALGGLPSLSVTTKGSWMEGGRVAKPLVCSLTPVPQTSAERLSA